MLIYLLRHGATAYTASGRYQGRRDVPLSPAGRAALRPADFSPETVHVSPLSRAVETAAILFPQAERILVPDLVELDFGVFEGRSCREMEDDGDYRAWVEGGCLGRCPGGESREEFTRRVCAAVARLVDEALASEAERLVIVAHGGVLMASLERFALPHRDYFDWQVPCGGGFLLDSTPWAARRKLALVRGIRYAKD
nr:histidine phosphatase family protein [uncultured Oscillibacter sp.]